MAKRQDLSSTGNSTFRNSRFRSGLGKECVYVQSFLPTLFLPATLATYLSHRTKQISFTVLPALPHLIGSSGAEKITFTTVHKASSLPMMIMTHF